MGSVTVIFFILYALAWMFCAVEDYKRTKEKYGISPALFGCFFVVILVVLGLFSYTWNLSKKQGSDWSRLYETDTHNKHQQSNLE